MSKMSDNDTLRILSLDGGGIRGISSLLILENIMEGIRETEGLSEVPKPCDYFDLIGGTSTGGIIAMMLGRLSMTVDECIRAYKQVANQSFTPKRTSFLPGSPSGTFSATALESVMKQVIRQYCPRSECLQRRQACPHEDTLLRHTSCTKTVILAATKNNVDTLPTLFSTYGTSSSLEGCTIWEVARATSAATTFFKPIKLGRDQVEFIDAAFGHNNPCKVLVHEAKAQFPDRQNLCILSIGTGLGGTAGINESRLSIIKGLKKMATTSHEVDLQMREEHSPDTYFRFNVDRGLRDIGLADWQKTSEISSHTQNYLRENGAKVRDFMARITLKTNTTSLSQYTKNEVPRSGLQATSSQSAKYGTSNDQLRLQSLTLNPIVPPIVSTPVELPPVARGNFFVPFPRNRKFVQRDSVWKEVNEKLFPANIEEHIRVALVGFGGAGKTQIALHLAYWTRQNYPEYSVFWISVVSMPGFQEACTDIANRLGLQQDKDEKSTLALRQYLDSAASGNWLLIIDNVDNPDFLWRSEAAKDGGVLDFLPENDSGRILLTTRLRDVPLEDTDIGTAMIHLSDMNFQEAKNLLRKSMLDHTHLRDEKVVDQMLEKLSCMPLALSQAASYINRNQISVAEYLKLFDSTQDRVELLKSHLRDSRHYHEDQGAVATTWTISFNQIRDRDPDAARLLGFMSYLEPKAIPISLLPGLDTAQQMTSALGTLRGYGFVVLREDEEMLDMHSLVHFMAYIWVEDQENKGEIRDELIAHVEVEFPSSNWKNRDKWRRYIAHAQKLLAVTKATLSDPRRWCDLAYWIGVDLGEEGRFEEGVDLLEQSLELLLGCELVEDEDRSLVMAQRCLGGLFCEVGKVEKGVQMLEQAFDKTKTWSRDDRLRLHTQHDLALAYDQMGKTKEAVHLLEEVVEARSGQDVDHIDRLASQQALATAYDKVGRAEEALKLIGEVASKINKALDAEDPRRLTLEHNFAFMLWNHGRKEDAIILLQGVVELQKNIFAERHANRLTSEHILATWYSAEGMWDKAAALMEHVAYVRTQTVLEDHPHSLASQHHLGRIYKNLGYTSKALNIMERVVEIRSRTLTEGDAHLTTSQYALGELYFMNGNTTKALELLERVVEVEARTLPDDDPERLEYINLLESIRDQGRE